MDFVTLFDVVVVSLVLILGIKGVISGLIKEIFRSEEHTSELQSR